MTNDVFYDSARELIIITHDGKKRYVELRANVLDTERNILNEIIGLHEKSWCNGKMLYDFITAMQEAINARFGVDIRALHGRKLNWRSGKIEEETTNEI
jgi:hypothetical protein